MEPQLGFQVNEEVRIGLELDWAVVGKKVVVKSRRMAGSESIEGREESILWRLWGRRSKMI